MNAPAENSPGRPRRGRLLSVGLVGLVVIAVVVGALWFWRRPPSTAASQPPPVPVTVANASYRDVPIYLDGLGTVAASNTTAIRSQIDGRLQSVNFREGQEVHQGDVLAVIDSRALQAALEQTIAKKAQDQAQLVSNQKDLTRFQTLALKSFETQQNVDQQQAKVDVSKAAIDADQAAIDAAQTQLSYTKIIAPIDGRVGFRQVDVGNIIHANDPNPLTVLTQIRPAVATYTLPQKTLATVREAMLKGPVQVLAMDQDRGTQLSEGQVLLIDNQIDQTTSTIRLKASFANADDRLWPGEFVRIRTLIDTRKDAIVVPPAAVQRGPEGLYTWVIKPDNTADQRVIDVTQVSDDTVIINKGVNPGERVVVNGQYRLQRGSRVDVRPPQTAGTPDKES